MPSVVSKSSPLSAGIWIFFFFFPFFYLFFFGVFHSAQPNPLVAKQWLKALLAAQRERVHISPGAVNLPNHLLVTLLPPFFFSCSPPWQISPITQPLSEVIWGSLEREELTLRVHLGRQKGLELYSLGSIANKAKPFEWRQSLFSVLWLILLVCKARREKVRWRQNRGRERVCVGVARPGRETGLFLGPELRFRKKKTKHVE